ncbi:hypothetical protein ES708_17719 [subsurface metagenome]
MKRNKEGQFIKGYVPWNKDGREIKCIMCGKKRWVRPSRVKEVGNFCSRECVHKYLSENYQGANAFSWKGGTPHEKRVYKEYILWRMSVFERDAFKCQICGDDKGHNLNAHHIKSFTQYPELRTLIENGITLCIDCHRKVHKGEINV